MSSTHRLSIGNVESFNKVQGSTGTSRRMSIASRRSSVTNSTIGEHSRWRRQSRQMSTSFRFNMTQQSKMSSPAGSKPAKPIIKMENTYKLGPDHGEKFRPGQIEKIIKHTFEQNLKGMKYEPRTCGIFAQRLAEEIKEKVREQNFKRYKVVSQVLINSKNEQSCEVASRALWNTETDNFASYTYQNGSFIALGLVHASYYE
ncbi:dynein light chain Tctex-type protein 2B-like [Antedon mediterranea]|uniref:dynein light chain Tctex-type protein 2B-like n=1 Tax=Antedon mediterranea TaxID=105859 RepID=UPI003AF6A3B7